MLVLQALLSLRLIWSNTAFQDEALYLWAGRAEIAHWLSGSPIPPYPVYFSGAPVIYPPLGALAASVGGLAGARLLSLAFMLTATLLLHGVTRRIFDRRAAVFAAVLFAGTGSVQFLGAFATYDAMALFLLALAVWIGVRATEVPFRRSLILLVLAGMILVLANATKYASALFDPAVIATVSLLAWSRNGRRAGVRVALIRVGVLAVGVGAALAIGGGAYWHGVTLTTLARPRGNSTVIGVLYASGQWAGPVAALAIIGAVAVTLTFRDRVTTALAWVLAATCLLAPIEQARIQTLTSLFKHVGFGAWFSCIVAGAALAYFPLAVPRARALRALRLSATAAALTAFLGVSMAGVHYAAWPNSRPVTAAVSGLIRPGGHYLAEDDDVLGFAFDRDTSWDQWTSTWFFRYVDPQTGMQLTDGPAWAAAIRDRYFNAVILANADTLPADRAIRRAIAEDGGYRLVRILPYRTTSYNSKFEIWVRTGPARI